MPQQNHGSKTKSDQSQNRIEKQESHESVKLPRSRLDDLEAALHHKTQIKPPGSSIKKTLPTEESSKTHIIEKGNLAVGQLKIIGQIHRSPERGYSPWGVEAGINSQFRIYRELCKMRPDAIVSEGISDEEDIRKYSKSIKAIFPHGIPSSLSELSQKQRAALLEYGADQIYITLHEKTGIVKNATLNTTQHLLEIYNGNIPPDLLFQHREWLMCKAAREYFTTHPGAKVAMTMGNAHHFSSLDYPGSSLPEITFTWFPDLNTKIGDKLMDSNSINLPVQVRMRYAEHATMLPLEEITVGNYPPETRIGMWKKCLVAGNIDSYSDESELLSCIRNSAVPELSKEEEAVLARLMAQGAGPFRYGKWRC